jgi:hypothetical protein
MSTLTWLDFSDAERQRALAVVELLAQAETRDELGLGSIRAAFADELFPGISTVQRRARYFVLIPWIYRDAEKRAARRSDLVEIARRRELQLIEVLLRGEDTDGVIGSRSRAALRQLPSIIYWQGLARWGIRRRKGTREQWARSVVAGVRARDDDGQDLVRADDWWHAGLPEPPAEWPDAVTLRLEPGEAAYLRERIRDTCHGSLLATLVEREHAWEEVEFPWQLPMAELDEHQRLVLRHAQRFSETMHSAALTYNRALAEQIEDESLEQQYTEDLARWVERARDQARPGAALAALWPLLADLGSRHSARTQRFVEDWYEATAEPDRVLRDGSLTDLVRERELQVKGRLARLSFDAARETWRGAAGIAQLDYRWSSAQRQLLDIVSETPA